MLGGLGRAPLRNQSTAGNTCSKGYKTNVDEVSFPNQVVIFLEKFEWECITEC